MNGLSSKLFTTVVLIVAAAVVYVFAAPSYRHGEPSIAGRRAEDFAFDLNGHAAHLSDLRGKVVVLNFWATWCPPCVAETDSLNALQDKIAPLGATVLGISVDEDADAYQKFLREHNVPFPNYRDPSKKIAEGYGTVMYPETYIIGTDGRIARKIIGPQDWDGPELSGYIESLIPRNSK
jgi:peroxiredoxin